MRKAIDALGARLRHLLKNVHPGSIQVQQGAYSLEPPPLAPHSMMWQSSLWSPATFPHASMQVSLASFALPKCTEGNAFKVSAILLASAARPQASDDVMYTC